MKIQEIKEIIKITLIAPLWEDAMGSIRSCITDELFDFGQIVEPFRAQAPRHPPCKTRVM